MRELAESTGKLVELEMNGGDTELDRALVDLLYEPLLHLLRNAVDHGIEARGERLAGGKREAGRIRVSAWHEGNQVVIDITDDGRGIDPAALKAKAVAAGVISAERAEEMTEGEALDLVFLDGLSTADGVTKVSGRGVGAAAVKGIVEQLRGGVSIRSERGLGTQITMRLPLTLAIIRGLLFMSGGQLLALPLLAVSEIARASRGDLVLLDGFECYRLRGRLVSLVRPGLALGFERRRGGSGAALRGREGDFFIIVLVLGGRRYGIVADAVVGEQELVIKPLESEWLQSDALTGASILGDGRVALIVDAEGLFRKAIKYEQRRGGSEAAHAG
jgi:two-component system chemotaxis sensor kinase CheA